MKSLCQLCLIFLVSSLATASDFYRVDVKRTNQDLYEIIGQNLHIVTRYCYKYTYGEEVIVRIDSQVGYNIGEIVFEDGQTCAIEKII